MAFRTKKISQMDPKGAPLASTDLLEISELVSGSYVTKSITGAEIIASAPAASWGTITGTLSTQTDLQNALDAKVPTSRTLTINGTTQDLSANRTFTVATGITIGTTAITSGVVGRVLFEGTGNVVQESANLFWDNVNGRLGVGTSSPSNKLDINGNATGGNPTRLGITNTGASGVADLFAFNDTGRFLGLQMFGSTATSTFAGINNANLAKFVTNNTFVVGTSGSNPLVFTVNGSVLTGEVARFSTNSNLLINTTTDAGFKLDVNGTARVVNTLTVGAGATAGRIELNRAGVSPSGYFYMSGNNLIIENASLGTLFSNGGFERMRISPTTGNVLINTTTDAGFKLDVNGTARVVNSAYFATTSGSVGIGTASPQDKLDINGSLRIRANSAGLGAVNDTSVIDYVPSTIFTTEAAMRLVSLGTGTVGGGIRFFTRNLTTDPDERMRITAGGNILINTTINIASSKLTIESTTQGFLPPRMTNAQKLAIASPATGLMVYDTTLNLISVYNGTIWISL